MFAATTDTAAAPPPDGVKLIFAGVGVVASVLLLQICQLALPPLVPAGQCPVCPQFATEAPPPPEFREFSFSGVWAYLFFCISGGWQPMTNQCDFFQPGAVTPFLQLGDFRNDLMRSTNKTFKEKSLTKFF